MSEPDHSKFCVSDKIDAWLKQDKNESTVLLLLMILNELKKLTAKM